MGRIRPSFKWGIFFSSYIPLYLILAYKHRSVTASTPQTLPSVGELSVPILSVFWVSLAVISMVALREVFKERRSKEPEPKNIVEAKNRNDAITNYILVYVFPFVVLDLSQTANWVAFIGFFLVIGFIQVRSNHLYVNPVLGLLGYNIYEADTEDEHMTLLIDSRLDDNPTNVSAVKLSYGVYIAV